MEFVLPGLKILTYAGVGVIIIGLLVLLGLFWGSRSYLNYLVGSIVCVAMGIFFLTLKSSGSIRFTETAVELKALLTRTQVVEYSSVRRAWIVDDVMTGDWRPAKKRSGTSAGDIRTGWFTLENGKKAYLVLQGGRAIVIEAGDRNHLVMFGIPEFDSLISAAGEHLSLQFCP